MSFSGYQSIPKLPKVFIRQSLKLSSKLDSAGFSEDVRKMKIDRAIEKEIISTCISEKHSIYVFGGAAEGSSLDGSDVDFLDCHEDVEILQRDSDYSHKSEKKTYLVVRIANLPPGYVILREAANTNTRTQNEQSSFLSVNTSNLAENLVRDFHNVGTNVSICGINGPAIALKTDRGGKIDAVKAFRCKWWPEEANGWIIRTRKYGWPSAEVIDRIMSFSVFLVPICNPSIAGNKIKSTADLKHDGKFKISFALQERELMFSLNTTQFKCYVLLKIIRGDINVTLGEECLTSYHCKTCLFYMLENTQSDTWRPKNLVACVLGCLDCLLSWTVNGYCPHYFIPEQNLFSDLVKKPWIQDELSRLLRKIIKHKKVYCLPEDLVPVPTSTLKLVGHFDTIVDARIFATFLSKRCKTKPETFLGQMSRIVKDIQSTDTITEHSIDQTKRALTKFSSYLGLFLMSYSIATQAEQHANSLVLDELNSTKWRELASQADPYSAILKQATFLYKFKQYKSSLEFLQNIEISSDKILMISCCTCEGHKLENATFIFPDEKLLCSSLPADILESENVTPQFTPCIYFMPNERNVVPSALSAEMLRPGENPSEDNCFVPPDWGAVDGEVLLYYLLFLTHKQLGMKMEAETYLIALHYHVTCCKLYHRRTALNLLGWCLEEVGKTKLAIECFEKSLHIQKDFNAAALHLENIKNKQKQRASCRYKSHIRHNSV